MSCGCSITYRLGRCKTTAKQLRIHACKCTGKYCLKEKKPPKNVGKDLSPFASSDHKYYECMQSTIQI